MAYAVRLNVYHGPLDLLLYLVKRDEVDIREVHLARLADSFLDYLATLASIDVELAGEFLVLAATLLEIKARSLLPGNEEPDEEEAKDDPRASIVRDLLEYRRMKKTAAVLEALADEAASHFSRVQPPPEREDAPQSVVRSVELWDLVSAFARLMRDAEAGPVQTIVADETAQADYEAMVREAVERAGRITFRDLFTAPFQRPRFLGLFLAVLELVKRNSLKVEQEEAFAEIWLAV